MDRTQYRGNKYYRSDWPELGLNGPVASLGSGDELLGWQGVGTNKWRWVSKPNEFESRLYQFPIWNLYLELMDSGDGWLAKGFSRTRLHQKLQVILHQFLSQAPWTTAYVATKVVSSEPLRRVLAESGFEEVERRCLYKTNLSDLKTRRDNLDDSVQYRSLAAIAGNERDRIREQILDICDEGFQQGYSRHFTDRFLVQRASGLSYIRNVMNLNFERTPARHIFLAQDAVSGRLCGFSILSERSGCGEPHYTQLLSSVRRAYRGRGVYAGLTRCMARNLPNDQWLLNVTHAENAAMLSAYNRTGRLPYADTLVLRRIFHSSTQSRSAQ